MAESGLTPGMVLPEKYYSDQKKWTKEEGARWEKEAAALGVDRAEAARRLGVCEVTLRYWETGRVAPNTANLASIALFLGRETHG